MVSPASDPADAEAIKARVATANTRFGRDEQISGLVAARDRFSVANGMLTSQFKPRRQRILKAYLTQASGKAAGDAI